MSLLRSKGNFTPFFMLFCLFSVLLHFSGCLYSAFLMTVLASNATNFYHIYLAGTIFSPYLFYYLKNILIFAVY